MSVLPDWYLSACIVDPADIAKCPCQWGPCGNCHQLGKHTQCVTRNLQHGRPPREAIAGIIGRRGNRRADVWPKWGRGCRWVCPCDCPITPAPPPQQLGLFALSEQTKSPPNGCQTRGRRSR